MTSSSSVDISIGTTSETEDVTEEGAINVAVTVGIVGVAVISTGAAAAAAAAANDEDAAEDAVGDDDDDDDHAVVESIVHVDARRC
jgi:hypothetical protein